MLSPRGWLRQGSRERGAVDGNALLEAAAFPVRLRTGRVVREGCSRVILAMVPKTVLPQGLQAVPECHANVGLQEEPGSRRRFA